MTRHRLPCAIRPASNSRAPFRVDNGTSICRRDSWQENALLRQVCCYSLASASHRTCNVCTWALGCTPSHFARPPPRSCRYDKMLWKGVSLFDNDCVRGPSAICRARMPNVRRTHTDFDFAFAFLLDIRARVPKNDAHEIKR